MEKGRTIKSNEMKIGIVVFTGVEELDAIAPYEVFKACRSLGYDIDVEMVTTEKQNSIRAFHGLQVGEVGPLLNTREHDLLIIPGGAWLAGGNTGVRKAVTEGTLPEVLRELKEQGVVLASVCTGAMLLGAAGLLTGRPANTHHSAIESLKDYGAEIRMERIVDDGDILTAGGVTSGLDLALWVIERFLGEEAEKKTEGYLEYQRRGPIWLQPAVGDAPYDLIAEEWSSARSRLLPIEETYIGRWLDNLPAGSRILDYGCGAGHPIASHLANLGYQITGIDGSEKLLAKAQARLPDQEWILAKLESAPVNSAFDRIICWDAIFHVRREHHAAILKRFFQSLTPGGKLLISSGGSAQDPFRDTMFGQTFFYDAHPPAEFVELLKVTGFEIEMVDFPDLPGGGRNKGKLAVIAKKAA